MIDEYQPCGACKRPVKRTRGRRPGQTWWHRNDDCQALKRRGKYASTRERQGLPAPTSPIQPARTCTHCGGEYRPRKESPLIDGVCSRTPECRREYRRRDALIRQRAMLRLAGEHPDRYAELLLEEAAQLTDAIQGRAA